CNKRYVDQLDQIGRSTVLSSSNSYDNLRSAREFINRLRTENVLDQCPDAKQADPSTSMTPTSMTPSSPPSTPPADPAVPNPAVPDPAATDPTATEAPGTVPPPPTPRPGVDCRPEHNESGGG
ncbi:MAG: hypothetical protein ABW215_02080, partial [Kibdelosporangium sp.]